jgi:hypothetical protein
VGAQKPKINKIDVFVFYKKLVLQWNGTKTGINERNKSDLLFETFHYLKLSTIREFYFYSAQQIYLDEKNVSTNYSGGVKTNFPDRRLSA